MTDEIDKAFAEAMSEQSGIDHYECRNCGLMFDSGRDARQHNFGEHDDSLGVKTVCI